MQHVRQRAAGPARGLRREDARVLGVHIGHGPIPAGGDGYSDERYQNLVATTASVVGAPAAQPDLKPRRRQLARAWRALVSLSPLSAEEQKNFAAAG